MLRLVKMCVTFEQCLHLDWQGYSSAYFQCFKLILISSNCDYERNAVLDSCRCNTKTSYKRILCLRLCHTFTIVTPVLDRTIPD